MNCSALYVGVDVSKHKHDIAVMNLSKQLVCKPFAIAESFEGYQYLLRRLEQLKEKYQAKELCIGLEATSDYWKNLAHFLKQQSPAFRLTVLNPVQIKAFTRSELRRAKTDPVNAKDIALFMVEKSPPPSPDSSPLLEAIKDLDRHLHKIKKRQTMVINRLRIELGKVAPEIEAAVPDFTGKMILALLLEFPTAGLIKNASLEELRSARYGKRQWRLPKSFVTRMKSLAEHSIAHKTAMGAGWIVQSLVREILNFQREEERLKNHIDQLYHQSNEKDSLLSNIPGISNHAAIMLEAHIGNVNRFPTVKQFVAYFGMNPTVSQSGKSVRRASRLEKKGSGRVRLVLFLAILNVIRHQKGPIYQYYKRLLDAGKPKMVALCAAMRKLLVIIYAILKTKQPFDPDYETKRKSKEKL
jgi:transposase